jgi:hypothetical protein
MISGMASEMETRCDFRAVGTEYLNIISMNSMLQRNNKRQIHSRAVLERCVRPECVMNWLDINNATGRLPEYILSGPSFVICFKDAVSFASNGRIISKPWISKDFEESGRDLIEVQPRNLREGAEGNHERTQPRFEQSNCLICLDRYRLGTGIAQSV